MKTVNESSKMVTVKLTSWQAVFEFLSNRQHTHDLPDQVLITKKEDEWIVQSESAGKKQNYSLPTTRFSGVGTFDLNW